MMGREEVQSIRIWGDPEAERVATRSLGTKEERVAPSTPVGVLGRGEEEGGRRSRRSSEGRVVDGERERVWAEFERVVRWK